MKNIALISAISLALIGCGGSSKSETQPKQPEQQTQPNIVVNTAPTIVGQEVGEFFAVEGGSLEYKLHDSDGDAIGISIESAQSWITTELNGAFLTLKFAPTLFDVGQHAVKITLLDGRAKTELDLLVTIKDNPEKWEEHALNNELLLGGWATEDESLVLAFNSANKGMAINQGKLGQLLLEKDAQGQLQTYIYDCNYLSAYAEPSHCSNRVPVNFKVIADAGDKIRVVYHPHNQTQIVKTLYRQAEPTIKEHFKYGISASGFSGNSINVSDIDYTGESKSIINAKLLHQNPEQTANVITAAMFVELEYGKVSRVLQDYSKRALFVKIPERIDSSQPEYLYQNTYNSLEVLYASDKYIVFDTSYEGKLWTFGRIDVSSQARDYINEYLKPQQGMLAITAFSKLPDATLKPKTQYLSRLYLENLEDLLLRDRSYSVTYFTTGDAGDVNLLMNGGEMREASYSVTNGDFNIELDGITTQVSLMSIPDSDLIFSFSTAKSISNSGEEGFFPNLSILTEVEEGLRLQDHLSQKFQNPYTGEVIQFEESVVKFTLAGLEQPYLQPVEYQEDGSANVTECNAIIDGSCWLPSGVVYNYKMVNKSGRQIILFKTPIAGAAPRDIEVFNIL
ncbi:hypothetical protein [Pseudoalteromonas luteoviolacea]|uniref:Dystroglycan-type cadherin-like domain-containing protein n=1 Tax=Pseudoalteromonas luteoviolacea S4060-1 TaxID=1365257 RepID=A0A167JKS3_9GAMM|nr:hypothetical protein [Pseudoalteromonas luteoviolacea]KZN61263.1 hypothetical protein N478_04160 [Pseudoalteromonas luteoviolacea S4060-1]